MSHIFKITIMLSPGSSSSLEQYEMSGSPVLPLEVFFQGRFLK